MIGSGRELPRFSGVMRSPASAFQVGKLFVKSLRGMPFRGLPMRLLKANVLSSRLARPCFDNGVPIRTRSPRRELLRTVVAS